MADAPATETPQEKKRGGTMMTLIIVASVALLEGGGFFLVLKFFGGGPGASYGADGVHVMEEADQQEESTSEIMLVEHFRVPNDKSGVTIIYDFDIAVAVPEGRADEMRELVKQRGGTVSDRIAQAVRRATPQVLGEDDFGTLRLVLKQALSEVVGDETMIRRVLIPRCVPMRTD